MFIRQLVYLQWAMDKVSLHFTGSKQCLGVLVFKRIASNLPMRIPLWCMVSISRALKFVLEICVRNQVPISFTLGFRMNFTEEAKLRYLKETAWVKCLVVSPMSFSPWEMDTELLLTFKSKEIDFTCLGVYHKMNSF